LLGGSDGTAAVEIDYTGHQDHSMIIHGMLETMVIFRDFV
jgi:hypothetical protein